MYLMLRNGTDTYFLISKLAVALYNKKEMKNNNPAKNEFCI